MLPHGEPGEFDARRPMAVAGDGGIEGGVDELGDLSGGLVRDP